MDCNDANPATHPGAPEICGDGLDNDCDGQTDEGCVPVCPDLDGDGFFGSAGCGTAVDCNDANPAIHPGATDVCGNGTDEDCTGGDGDDADADGWSPCDGDCQESAGAVDPRLINPGAFEFVGDGLDNDCDPATSDATQALCSQAGKLTGVSAADLASAMDLCQSTTDSPPLPERKWGLLSTELLAADGSAPDAARLSDMQNFQVAALQNYGTGGVVPEVGVTMAGLSTGRMRDASSPGYVAPNLGSDFGSVGQPPADYLLAHGGSLPSSAGCSGSCPSGAGANDSANLRLRIRVPTNARSLSYRYRFFTAEYWEYACTIYNDFHLALLQGTALGIPADRNIAFDSRGNPMSVNNANFDICEVKGCNVCPLGTPALSGTGMDEIVVPPLPQDQGMTGGGTPWLNITAPVVPGESITLDLMIFDVSDNILDSLVLLDGFTWLP